MCDCRSPWARERPEMPAPMIRMGCGGEGIVLDVCQMVGGFR